MSNTNPTRHCFVIYPRCDISDWATRTLQDIVSWFTLGVILVIEQHEPYKTLSRGIGVVQSLASCAMFIDHWLSYYPFSLSHCIVCPEIYRFLYRQSFLPTHIADGKQLTKSTAFLHKIISTTFCRKLLKHINHTASYMNERSWFPWWYQRDNHVLLSMIVFTYTGSYFWLLVCFRFIDNRKEQLYFMSVRSIIRFYIIKLYCCNIYRHVSNIFHLKRTATVNQI